MATQYFTKFPQTIYDMSGDGTDIRLVRDIIHHARFIEIVRTNNLIMYPYHVKDKETPDIIAHKLYGDSQYFWIVMLCNKIYNMWDNWVLSYDQFQAFIVKKYGSFATANSTVHHYQDKYGNVIDHDTYTTTIGDGSIIVSSYQYESDLNDSKRSIVLIDAKYVKTIENQLDNLLIPIKK